MFLRWTNHQVLKFGEELEKCSLKMTGTLHAKMVKLITFLFVTTKDAKFLLAIVVVATVTTLYMGNVS